jgi:hypothetical protein
MNRDIIAPAIEAAEEVQDALDDLAERATPPLDEAAVERRVAELGALASSNTRRSASRLRKRLEYLSPRSTASSRPRDQAKAQGKGAR